MKGGFKMMDKTSNNLFQWIESKMPLRTILALIILTLGGGGGVAVLEHNFVSAQEVEKAINNRMSKEDERYNKLSELIEAQSISVKELTKNLNKVQNSLDKQVARSEAFRITSNIKNRIHWKRAYDRVYDLNMIRLRLGKEPCQTLTCDH